MDATGEALNQFATWAKGLAYVVFSAFAGGLGYILRAMNNGYNVSWKRVVVEMLGSGFSGVVVLWICQVSKVGAEWTGIIVGITGWLGAQATILALETLVRRKLGLERSSASENPPSV